MTDSAAELLLYFELQTTAHSLKRYTDDQLRQRAGISTAQAAVLMTLSGSKPVSQRHVARMLRQQESATATMVSRLLRDGLIRRERSQTDSRRWNLRLTRAGQGALKRAKLAFAEVNQSIEGALPRGSLPSFASALIRLREALPPLDDGPD